MRRKARELGIFFIGLAVLHVVLLGIRATQSPTASLPDNSVTVAMVVFLALLGVVVLTVRKTAAITISTVLFVVVYVLQGLVLTGVVVLATGSIGYGIPALFLLLILFLVVRTAVQAVKELNTAEARRRVANEAQNEEVRRPRVCRHCNSPLTLQESTGAACPMCQGDLGAARQR